MDYAVFGFIIAFFSSLVGQMLMGRLRQARSASGRTFERNSYITFVIGTMQTVTRKTFHDKSILLNETFSS